MLNLEAQSVKIIRLNRGPQIYSFGLTNRGEQGRAPGAIPSKSAPACESGIKIYEKMCFLSFLIPAPIDITMKRKYTITRYQTHIL